MNEMKDALLRLVRSWTKTNKALESFVNVGMDSNLLFQVCGEIEEAICILVGEADKDLEDTVTHTALTAPILTEDRRVYLLMAIREKNMNTDSKPRKFMTPEEMKNMVVKNGGYLSGIGFVPPKDVEETPEGEWT